MPKRSWARHNLNSGLTKFACRGDRHHGDLWKALLPNARRKLIDEGLFTADGVITAKGTAKLQELLKKGAAKLQELAKEEKHG